ncbi:MAG: GtrA family protein [Bacteroidota bacterium]|nr:GtrA family protein [Bacteroidota bacterium]
MRDYLRFTASSAIATTVDYLVTIVLTEACAVMYVLSSLIGLLTGGTLNYLINKNWVFGHGGSNDVRPAALYALVWLLNLLANTLGLYLLTEYATIDYRISKVITAVAVGMLLSYSAQKHLVFRERRHIAS